jgi:hypothetical protein
MLLSDRTHTPKKKRATSHGTRKLHYSTPYEVERLRCPVILDDGGVIDRNISRTAFEITHGVATLKHQLTDQLVRLDD